MSRRLRWAGLAGLGLLLVLSLGIGVSMALRVPRINDITTDFDRPPRYLVSPPANPDYDAARFRKRTEEAYSDVTNLVLPEAPDAVFARVLSLIQSRGWRIVAQDPAARRVQVIAITPLLRFRDDVAVEVRADAGRGSIVAMRSKSRLGKSDLGANAARIRAFFGDLGRS
jgi:uncharacterized protein (DUF1499 family)